MDPDDVVPCDLCGTPLYASEQHMCTCCGGPVCQCANSPRVQEFIAWELQQAMSEPDDDPPTF